jgi:hypothetical protein
LHPVQEWRPELLQLDRLLRLQLLGADMMGCGERERERERERVEGLSCSFTIL